MLLVIYLIDFIRLLYSDPSQDATLVLSPRRNSKISHAATDSQATDSQATDLNSMTKNSSRRDEPVPVGALTLGTSSSSSTLAAKPTSADAQKPTLLSYSSTTSGSIGYHNPVTNTSSGSTSRWVPPQSSGPSSFTENGGKNQEITSGQHPMNRDMSELFVPGNTGELPYETVKEYYRNLAKAYLSNFKNGIYRQLYFDILRRRTYALTPPGANKGIQSMLIQVIDRKVYLMDPYEVPKNSKPFYRTRINEVIWLLSKLASEGRIKNTEFLMSIHDCVQTVNKPHSYRGAHFQESNPAFTIVSCNFSDNIPFPMWEGSKHRDGGFSGWDALMAQYHEDDIGWDKKVARAVFRGGIRPSMYFKNKSEAENHCNDVGRARLRYLAQKEPEVFDISVGGACGGKYTRLERLEPKDHHKFKYIIYAEGNCMWADRSRHQVFGPSAIIKQETPCGQFFEPMMKPYVHYIPTDFFFSDTVERIQWARNNDAEVQTIVKNANDFARNFLTLRGIEAYVEVLLQEYTALLVEPDFKLENGAIDVTNKQV